MVPFWLGLVHPYAFQPPSLVFFFVFFSWSRGHHKYYLLLADRRDGETKDYCRKRKPAQHKMDFKMIVGSLTLHYIFKVTKYFLDWKNILKSITVSEGMLGVGRYGKCPSAHSCPSVHVG